MRFSEFCYIRLWLALATVFATVVLEAADMPEPTPTELMVAQKLMIDIRHFDLTGGVDFEKAVVPVTMLPPAISDMVEQMGLGGVILFSENLKSTEAILRLTKGLQDAAAKGGHPPLLIATDQEGGRVVRLPSHIATSFAGNMALGATQKEFKTTFAAEVAAITSRELLSVGINTNLAPVVDVNTNPENPVINTRSFGDIPENVAELGAAVVNSMQKEEMIATLKHFPGHGNTLEDSHSKLPGVDRALAEVESVELYPFAKAIEWAAPEMVMVGHLQYPALDSSQFPWPALPEPVASADAEDAASEIEDEKLAEEVPGIIWPASLSRKITTDVLRGWLGYKGVVITDALDMKAITQYFTPTQAVINAFRAGADIALMPMKVETPDDIGRLRELIAEVAAAVDDGRLDRAQMEESVARIAALKAKYPLTKTTDLPLVRSVAIANKTLGKAQHRRIEQELANHSIVVLKNQAALPILAYTEDVFLHMPNTAMAVAFKTALHQRMLDAHITYSTQLGENADVEKALLAHAEVVIMADVFPDPSPAELEEGLGEDGTLENLSRKEIIQHQMELLKLAKKQGKRVIFVCLRTPYRAQTYAKYSDAVLVSFDYRVNRWDFYDPTAKASPIYEGPAYSALANVITGSKSADAALPVQLEPLDHLEVE